MIDILERIIVQGHDLDIYGSKEEPLFLAVDIAKLIDYSNGHTGQMLDSVDPGEKLTTTIERAGQKREMCFLTEYGLYEVLMQSRKPIARRFKSSVKKILKDIRLRDEGNFEYWLNGPDPLVDEWEIICIQREEDKMEEISFEDFLKEYKGYTDDML